MEKFEIERESMNIYKTIDKILNYLALFEKSHVYNQRFDHLKPLPKFLSLQRLNTSTLKRSNEEIMKHLLAFTIKH